MGEPKSKKMLLFELILFTVTCSPTPCVVSNCNFGEPTTLLYIYMQLPYFEEHDVLFV